MLTCLIPAWNEAPRIAAVLQSVIDHPLIDRILVIDDGSTDGTGDVARSLGAEVLRTPGNLGKTAALVMGLQKVMDGHVLLLDADLIGLTKADLSALILPVQSGQATASFSLRGNAPWVWRLIGLDYISGERVIPLNLLTPHLDKIAALPRFGFEVFLNKLLIHAGIRLAIVSWPKVASPSKASKRGCLVAGLRADLAMIGDMFRTMGLVGCVAQILALRRQRI
ncbi:glycosyltransferase family 2 protein [Neogemmobacter tilapiae]|uniref:Glycosyl transferase n=1 Tax=Neogemmobacter tilapiae TaxID=875041 RepID=A0A918WP98_9RHOB|nr:glycosyltransferase [Gemmobacter tilapiae]GHC64817.1 glycosyl transferase [Gemmobacter tilapiae]